MISDIRVDRKMGSYIWTRPERKSFQHYSQQDRDAYIYPASLLSGKVFHSGHDGICTSSPYHVSGLKGPTPFRF